MTIIPRKSSGFSLSYRISRIYSAALLLIAALCILPACKPTEKNYRSAYDTARQKTLRQEAEILELQKDLRVAGNAQLQEVDGVRLEPLGTDTLWTMHRIFAAADSVAPYSLAAGRMKMRANALAMAEDLGKNARAARSGEEFFIIVAESDELHDIISLRQQYLKANPGFRPLNLPDLTIIMR